MATFIKLDGVDGEANAAHSGANLEITVKVLDTTGLSYGAMTDVEYALTVTDTETGQVTEQESGLIYSGESGGINESATGGGHYTQIMWDDTNAAAAEASGPMKESMETMKKAWKDASATPEGVERDADAADTQSNPPSWGLDRIDENASGSGGGTGKVSVHDISITKHVDVGDAAGPFAAYGDGFTGGVFVATGDVAVGSWTEHGTILTGDAPAADRPGPFMGVYVGSCCGGTGKVSVPGGDLGADDLALFEADAAAPGNTYLGMTTIEQGVLEVGHATMMLSFQYDLG